MKLYTSKRHFRERFEFIETKLFWGNGLTAGELGETFDISRPAAQKVIDDYKKAFPGQMVYNPHLKRHTPEEGFEPVLIRKDPLYFLDYLRGQSLTGLYREEPEWSDIVVTDVDRLLRPKLVLEMVKPIFYGLLHKKVVIIDYRKKNLNEGEKTVRSISPNHLVFADDRYHLRAYCHHKDNYLDFVLTRIAYSEISGSEEWVSSYGDKEWNEYIELSFKPNPDLPQGMQESVLTNYDFKKSGIRKIKCRKSLSFYIKNKLLAEDMKYKIPLWILDGEEKAP
jgi:hypothetical protein